MNFNVNVGVCAVFKLVARKANTGEIARETPDFFNLVLTTGLAKMAGGAWIDRCCIGTGNSATDASQVALDNFLASTTAVAPGAADTGGIQVTTEPYYWYGRRTWRFAVGVATGNISEVMLGWGNSNAWNRALIKDTAGNPTTITVLADEYLDVISEVRIYPKESTGSFNLVDKLGAVISSHNYVARPRFSSYSSGGAAWRSSAVRYAANASLASSTTFGIGSGSIPTAPTGAVTTQFTTNSLVHTELNNGLKASKVISSSEANIVSMHRSFSSNLYGLMCGGAFNYLGENSCGFNWQVDPPIPKDDETILTYSFTLTWENYAPE
ncbi:hypothetical protein [Acinetobacter pragensis]|uniref:Uncharacterized protein n=1 Tax=Acinetobacter pragensis TaxID=1806892 RepID=A0A151Y1Y2_9GAMM|nr:hypothetical protein [Acinetobacter pragensis]KYQ72041.1 hypothetical protein AZH43_12560 [Acinetobacter pragensis]